MKTTKYQLPILFLSIWLSLFSVASAQEHVYVRAMQAEVKRGMEGLVLDQLIRPGFISYHIVDANALHIQSVLGGIVSSWERRMVTFDNRVLVIKNGVSNENFLSMSNIWGGGMLDNSIPLTGSVDDVRRALWLATDDSYKSALSDYEAKISAMSQQNLSAEERALVDFLPAEKVTVDIPYKAIGFDRSELEKLAVSASAVFAGYSSILSSQVDVFVYDGEVFYHNSDGTTARYPFQIAAFVVKATAQATTGEMIYEHYTHYAKQISELPGREELTAEVREMAAFLDKLSRTDPVVDAYTGPVLFEGQAAAELFAQVCFRSNEGFIANRKPIVGSDDIARFAPRENSLEARLGNRIMSRDLSVTAYPGMSSFQGEPLFGSYPLDAEGLVPPDSVRLVEDGMLQTLLSSRIPTLKVPESNGHARLGLNMGGVNTVTAPGVVALTVNDEASFSQAELREMLLQEARAEGLDYAYIVRKVTSNMVDFSQGGGGSFIIFGASGGGVGGNISKTIRVYRIYVEDGREELVSLAEVKGINIRSFRRILGASEEMQVYNTMMRPAGARWLSFRFPLSGVPVSFITPQALLFEEIEVVRERQQVVKKPPVVANPVSLNR